MGASVAAHAIDPDLAVALDVTHATIPQSRADTTVPLERARATYGPLCSTSCWSASKGRQGPWHQAQHRACRALYLHRSGQYSDRARGRAVRADRSAAEIHAHHGGTAGYERNPRMRQAAGHFLGDLDEGWNEALWS